MKQRLLMMLSVFMTITSVGWLHAAEDGVVTTAQALRDSVANGNGTTIKISGTIDLDATPLSIKRNLQLVGVDTATTIVKGRLRVEGSSQQEITLTKLKIVSADTAVALNNPKVKLTLETVAISAKYGLRYNNYESNEAPEYIVKNSGIHTTMYPLWTRSVGAYSWTVENSVLEGWCAMYMSLGTPIVSVTNSRLSGTNAYSRGSGAPGNSGFENLWGGNSFGTIIFEATQNANMTLDNSTVEARWTDGQNEVQNPVVFQTWNNKANTDGIDVENNVVTMNKNSSMWIQKAELTPNYIYHFKSQDGKGVVKNNCLKTDGTASFTYGSDKKEAIVVMSAKGDSLRTAVTPTQGGLKYLNNWISDNDILQLPAGKIELEEQWSLLRPLTLQGSQTAETVITATGDWDVQDNSLKNLISVGGTEQTIEGDIYLSDLTLTGSKRSGINIQTSLLTHLKNFTSKDNPAAGIIVHSKVKAIGLKTKSNGWGGVNIDKGSPSYPLSFSFDATSSFDEPLKIWSEVMDAEVIVPANDTNWRSFISDNFRVWTNASLSIEAKDAAALTAAIKSAQPGQIITLTGSTYGTPETIQCFGQIKAANVTIKAKDISNKPKVYGTIKVLAEGCTIEGLDMYTKSDGSANLKNIIDVVAMSATIKDNVFNMLEPTEGNVSNGLNIWPFGSATTTNYVVKGNSFKGFKATVTGWSSTAMMITEGVELSRFGYLASEKSKAVAIANEDDFRTGNTFADCYSDYVHSNYEKSGNTAGVAPEYSYAVISSNAAALSTAVNYSGDKAKIFAKGTYAFDKQLTIGKSISITGVVAANDTTKIEATGTWSGDDSVKDLLNITADNVSLKNLVVQKSQLGGINVSKAKGVKLDNVISRNNVAGGMVVNSSLVAISNFKTSGNELGYGIKVDKDSDGEATLPVLTIGEGCVFGEAIAVKSDLKDAPSSYVIGSGWVQLKKGEGENAYMVWANAATSGINISITSVPAKVIYGQATLPLIANVEEATIEIAQGAEENVGVVELKKSTAEGAPDSLIIKKPGEAVLTIKANDMVVTQTLTVLKKTLTVAGITAKTKSYDGKTEVTLETKGMEVRGLVGDDAQADVLNTPTGVLASANVGDAVPVNVTATFKSKADYYELAPITGVTDTVKKVALTVKAAKPTAVNYGEVDPSKFTATTSGFVNSEDATALSGNLQFDCPATNASLAGKYPVMPYGYTSQNYAITYVADSLEVKAINPTVELVSATIGTDKTSATVKGRITSNGGTKTTDLKGDFKVGDVAKGLSLAVDKDGNFSTTLTGLTSAQQSIYAVAANGDLTGTSAAMRVDLRLNLQNVAFVSELSRLVYGSKATVGAKGFAEGAKVTFSSSDASILSITDSIQVEAKKAGTATLTVTAALEGYITAIAKQTVTVEPKALTVAASNLDKVYDGTTIASPTYALNNVLDADKSNVTVSATGVTANYLDKNAAANKTVVLSGALTLSGTAAGNYSLTQPANLKGTISKAGEVTVTVADATRKYNETALRYNLTATGLVADETLTTPNLYTGVISVSENAGKAEITLNGVSFANYSSVKAVDGTVTVVKGTPRVLTLSGATVDAEVTGIIIDKEGWETSEIEIIKEAGNGTETIAETEPKADKYYAQVTYGDGLIARGASIEQKAAPVIEAAAWEWAVLPQTKAFGLRAATNSQTLTYRDASTFKDLNDFTFETSNPAVITLSDGEIGKKQVNAVGVGTAAILATNKEGGVTYLEVTVTPAQLAVTTTGLNKVYDGTNLANLQVALTEANSDGVYIDLEGVQFTYASKDAGSDVVINSSKPLVLTGEKSANYTIEAPQLKGTIAQRDLTVNGPVSKYYDGTAKELLTNYSAEGLISGEEVPVTATFADAAAGTEKTVALQTASKNYKLNDASVKTGSILKSTIDVTLNQEASAATASAVVKDMTVRETGKKVTVSAIGLKPTIVTEGSGDNTVYFVSGGDTDNYTVVYASNQIGFKAEEDGGGDSGDDATVSAIILDKTELMLARLETYTLKATLEPSTITGKTISWTSSNDEIATVDADGKVTAVAIGEATITATVDGQSATCIVTVTAATALEDAIANTRVYGKDGSIRIEPQMPMNVLVVNLVGQILYNSPIDGASQIAVPASGIYIVKLGTEGETKVHKISVKQ